MELITRERNRLLHRIARAIGLSFAIVSLLCLCVPGAAGVPALAACAPLSIVLAVGLQRMGTTGHLAWIVVAVLAGLAIIAVVLHDGPPTVAATTAVTELAAACLGCVAVVLTLSAARLAVLAGSFAATAALTTIGLAPVQPPARTIGLEVLAWGIALVVGAWIRATVPRVAKRIASIGRAHHAERTASELEAQRRQDARLLHDTVLATLTLLAHSGVGVSPAVLRQQAGEDARLLRQLRLGAPLPGHTERPPADADGGVVLGRTLESVQQRFRRMGLEVVWHGTGTVPLEREVLDALVLALAECLENVRRHAGVSEAHVTISEDDARVRAVVTDAGVGFEPEGVGHDKLGFTESVVARLREVGGNARLFSTPGHGTTVVLEVPR